RQNGIVGGWWLMWRRRSMLAVLVAAAGAVYGVPLAGAAVLRVGTWNGIRGPYKTIQAAVNAARPGDWVLVGPGDYKERGHPGGRAGLVERRRRVGAHRAQRLLGQLPDGQLQLLELRRRRARPVLRRQLPGR